VKGEINLRLFTMGDPVRQFLNRFSRICMSGSETPENALQDLGSCPTPPGKHLAGMPDPERLGVERWVNAYRSGDYMAVPFGSTNGTTARTVVEPALPPTHLLAQDNAAHHSVKKCVSAPEPTSTIGISPRRTLLRNLMTSFAGINPL